MKKITTIFFAILLIGCGGGGGSDNQPSPSTMNHWAKLFGRTGLHSEARAIQQISDGGFITGGQTGISDGDSGDILAIRTDVNGNILWNYVYEAGGTDNTFGMVISNDSGFIFQSKFAGGNPYLLKIGSNGNIVWAKSYTIQPSTTFSTWWNRHISNTNDNGYIVCGSIPQASSSSNNDGIVVKIDSNGNIEWQKKYTGVADLEFRHIEQTLDSGYIVTGSNGPSPIRIVLIKIDSLGNITWQKSYGGSFGDNGKVVKQTRDGGFILLSSILSFSRGNNYDIWVVKLDNVGNIQWQKVFAGAADDEGEAIEQTSDDGYIITGHSQSFTFPITTGWVFKLEKDGTVGWQRVYNGEFMHDIHQTADQGSIVAGHTPGNVQNKIDNFWILKLEADGSCSPVDKIINVSPNTFSPNITVTMYTPENILMNVIIVSSVTRSSPVVNVIQQAP